MRKPPLLAAIVFLSIAVGAPTLLPPPSEPDSPRRRSRRRSKRAARPAPRLSKQKNQGSQKEQLPPMTGTRPMRWSTTRRLYQRGVAVLRAMGYDNNVDVAT